MTQAQTIMLDCLAEAVFHSTVSLPESPDWDAVFTEALNQSILPLVYFAVRPRRPEETVLK